jgi:GDPmannose 4,6-dehydratase
MASLGFAGHQYGRIARLATVIIFGVDGQDGSYLAELLLGSGDLVIGWSPQTVPVVYDNIRHLLGQITLLKGDLTQQEHLTSCLEEYRPDEVYNLASPSSPVASWDAPVEVGDVTALGAARLLEAIRLVSPKTRYYQASSSEIFGDPFEVPQNEETPFQPRNPYGIAKLYAYWMTVRYRQAHGLYAVSGILYNHESPRRPLHFVTRKITHTAARIKLGLSEKLSLGDLDARRDWGYAGDYVRAIWLMTHQEQPQDFVIGSGQTHSVRQLCEVAFGYLNLDYQDYVVQDERFMRPSETHQLVADPSKAKRCLGWNPEHSFEELIQMMVETDLRKLKSSTKED